MLAPHVPRMASDEGVIAAAKKAIGKALIEAAGTASNRTRVVGRREKAETDAAR